MGDLFGYFRAPLSVVTEDGCLKLPQDVVDHLKLDPTRGVSFVRRFRAAGRIGLVPVVEVVADDAYLQGLAQDRLAEREAPAPVPEDGEAPQGDSVMRTTDPAKPRAH